MRLFFPGLQSEKRLLVLISGAKIAVAIDDPKRAAEEIIKAEERQDAIVPDSIQAITRFLPFPFKGIVETALAFVIPDQVGRVKYLLEQYSAELDRHDARIAALSADHQLYIERDHGELLQDAIVKARDTRSKKRIQRFARILVRGSLNPECASNPERIEGLNEIARNLDETDVLTLSLLLRRAEAPVERQAPPGRAAPLPAGTYRGPWSEAPIKIEGMSAEEIQTSCSRLQGFGLAIVDNETKWDEYRAFRILSRGREFISYIQDATAE